MKKTKFKISIRRTQDIELIKSLNDAIFPGESLNVSSNTYHWIARDRKSGKPVGFCSCSYIGYGTIFLSRSGLLRKYRGGGVQKRFIRIREAFARKNEPKISKIITYVLDDNYESLSSLIKLGYLVYLPEWNYAGTGFIYVIKEISI